MLFSSYSIAYLVLGPSSAGLYIGQSLSPLVSVNLASEFLVTLFLSQAFFTLVVCRTARNPPPLSWLWAGSDLLRYSEAYFSHNFYYFLVGTRYNAVSQMQ